MAKKKAKKAIPVKKPIKLPDDKAVYLDMSFEEAVKKALNTPIKKKK